ERARLQVCEISRKLFVREPESGGLIPEEESSPAYNGKYAFAEGEAVNQGPDLPMLVEPPLQVTMRARCAFCHGDGLAQLNTFSIARPRRPQSSPPVKRLNPNEHETVKLAIAEKEKSRDFQALLAYFDRHTARH